MSNEEDIITINVISNNLYVKEENYVPRKSNRKLILDQY